MKASLIGLAILSATNFAKAESAWDYDSCMENLIRQFSCSIDGKDVEVDLESTHQKMSYKVPEVGSEKVLGVFVHDVNGGELYIKCDDSGKLEDVQFSIAGASKKVSCK